ncbi:MlaD family protein [uncultured Jannaschia sp.]|uniref:MlaD family protein n=1 Tax=uncultured Jannaschia sp. TaxID=293347 RepID=UPI002630F64B|nr:MlaD family protein [uncultured Jannaschia sp.]
METRANFVLIGAFTLVGILGAIGFAIWLANARLDQEYAYYGILFDDVTGLDASGDVRFNGIGVGQVIERRIFEPDPSQVFVRIEIDASTPVRENTVAQLNSSGVTGVSYISLSNSRAEAPSLTAPAGEVPIIRSRASTIQQLVEGAPDLVAEATALLEQFRKIAGPENQRYIAGILGNLEAASDGLEQALADFSGITGTVADAAAQIDGFAERIDAIGEAAQATLANADAALDAATGAFDAAQETLEGSGEAIDSAGAAFAQAEALMTGEVPAIVARVRDTAAALDAAVTDVAARTGSALDGFGRTANLLNARLAELEVTLSEAETAFAAVTEASDSFDALVDGDGALLVAEARAVLSSAGDTFATIEEIVDRDVPAVVADVRTAAAVASDTVDQVAADVSAATGRLDPLASDAQEALRSAAGLFERAQTTLDGLDGTLAAADATLRSADGAFGAATNMLSTDLDPLLADLRDASQRIRVAAEQVSDDLPAVSSDLRGLIERADAVVAQVQSVVGEAAPGIQAFTGSGLNELTGLSAEARTLVQSLEQLIRRIGNDPARFILDDRVPEYRR